MAINFPFSPADGAIFTDPNGTQWVYNSSETSWTSLGIVNDTGGLKYKGALNITSAPPAAESGEFWSVETGGTANGGFGPNVTGTISAGDFVLYDGVNWEQINVDPLWNRSGGDISPINASDTIHTDSGLKVGPSGLPNIELNSDGSATFGGNVDILENTRVRGRLNVGTNNAGGMGDGVIVAGDHSATNGQVMLAGRYTVADSVPIIGSMYSAGATLIGSSVRSSTSQPGTFLSTAGNASWKRGALEVGGDLKYSSAAAQSTAVGSEVTMTERFRVDYSGNVLIGGTSAAPNIQLKGSDGSITAGTYNGLTVGRGAGNISNNTVVGYSALFSNTTGIQNTANGYQALFSNTTGIRNTANGTNALYFNTEGSNNVANGRQALYSNTTGSGNVANGTQALFSNDEGSNNVANGRSALYKNTTGDSNVANGYAALYNNTTGGSNVANGTNALYFNTEGSNNVANGRDALNNNTTGSGNIGIGFRNSNGTYSPVFDPTTEDNRLVLGHTSITNAYVKVAWTVTSDERDKMNFAPVPYGLDFVNQLKPTAYQFKVDRDTETPNGDVRYGFKAQDILALEGDNPVIIDTEDADHLKYKGEHLVPVLVNAVQELTAMVKDLQAEIKTLKG